MSNDDFKSSNCELEMTAGSEETARKKQKTDCCTLDDAVKANLVAVEE